LCRREAKQQKPLQAVPRLQTLRSGNDNQAPLPSLATVLSTVYGLNTLAKRRRIAGCDLLSSKTKGNKNMIENSSSGFPANSSLTNDETVVNIENDCSTAHSTAAVVLKSLAYLTILLVSLVGNILVSLVVWRNKPWKLHKSINYFVFNMAVSDVFTPLTIMPVKIVQIISGSDAFMVDSPLMLGNILCKMCYFLPDVSVIVSVESLLLISLDRFATAVFPLKSERITSKVRLICILCAWIIAIAVCAPYFYTIRLFSGGKEYYCEYDWGPAFDHDETSKRYTTATFLAIIAVPICILVVVYGAIAFTLRRTHNQSKEISVGARSCGYQKKWHVIRLPVAIVTSFIFCMVPHLVFMFCTIFLWNWDVLPICALQTMFPFVPLFMVHSWSAVNPCICFIFSKNYRRALKKLLSQ